VPTRTRTTLWLFLLFTGLFALTSSGRVRTADEYMVFFQTESLATHGTLTVPQAVRAGNFFGKYDLEGQPRAGYLPFQALVASPFYRLGQRLVRLPGIPDRARTTVLALATCWSSAVLTAGAVALFFLLSWHLADDMRAAGAAAAALAFATFLWPYAGYFFSEPTASLLLIAAAAVILTARADEAVPLPRALIAGALLGACVWVRFTHMVAVPVFVVALMLPHAGRGWRSAVALAGVVSMAALGLLAYNHSIWGHALDMGYPATAEGGRPILVFTAPWYRVLYGMLLSPGKSLFLFAPPVLSAIVALPRLRSRHVRAFALAVLMPAAYLLFFMRYTQWEGGYCVGPRYLLPVVPLVCLALAPGLARSSRRERWLFILLCAFGVAVQVVSASTSFLEDEATPLRYYDAGWGYEPRYAPLVSQGRLLGSYVMSRSPAPLGLGFDRWFVFLNKAGVEPRTIAALMSIPLAGLGLAAAMLGREWSRARQDG
jgi:hypothetical protein